MTFWGKRKAVLAVHLPGRAPYAVFDPKFRWPRGKADYAGAGLPALVSTTDPADVEILWDEVPSVEDQIARRTGDALRGQAERMDEARQMQQQMMDAALNTRGNPTMPNTPMTKPLAEAMAENAKQTLAYVTDPAMREMLIRQYRAAGISVDEGEKGP